jgi:hypothetical protein
MPPRFVEIATPIEDGVEWAGSTGNAFVEFVSGLVEHAPVRFNVSTEGYETLLVVRDAVSDVPRPKGTAAFVLVLAMVVAIIRFVFVRYHATWILKKHGSRAYKEL